MGDLSEELKGVVQESPPADPKEKEVKEELEVKDEDRTLKNVRGELLRKQDDSNARIDAKFDALTSLIQEAVTAARTPVQEPKATSTNSLDDYSIPQLETEVADGNADLGNLGYVMSAKGRGIMKQVDEGTDTGFRLWSKENTVNGYSAFATNQIPNDLTSGSSTGLSAVIFGNWNDLIIGMWGALDILVDPYTGSTSGTVRVVALQDLDVQLRHVESFAAILDMRLV